MLNLKKRALLISVSIFCIVELAIGIAVQLTEDRVNAFVSFSAVILACIFHLLFMSKARDYLLTQAALIFTVLADTFLVLIEPRMQLAGMCCFLVVQISYFLRIYLSTASKRLRDIHLCVRAAVSVVISVITLAVLGDDADVLSIISLIYFANLMLNIVFAFFDFKRNALFPMGLLLFALCDVFVGFDMIGAYIPVKEGSFAYFLANPGFNAAWLFYVPAQTLLALSLVKFNNKTVPS